MWSPELELELSRFLVRLRAPLRGARDADQALRSILRSTMSFIGADAGCIAHFPSGKREAGIFFQVPSEHAFDGSVLTRLLRGDWPGNSDRALHGLIRRRGRVWGAMCLHRTDGDFTRGYGKALARIAETTSELVQHIDLERIREVRHRIDRKIMQEIRGKDLFYQILHGLRSLTGYDHSSALLVPGEQGQVLVIEAEQIAFLKAKSHRVGRRLRIDERVASLLQLGEVYGFEREYPDDSWREWTGFDATPIAALLDTAGDAIPGGDAPREEALLCAAIASRDGPLGLLKIASRTRGSLGPYEADLVKRFLPHVAVAIQNSRRAETLQSNLVEAERRSAMSDLARGVAHDVNNALGAVLPLVQEIRQDLENGEALDPDELLGDMKQIEQSFLVCRRIFGGMLSFAKGSGRQVGTGRISRAVESALVILEDGLRRRRIERDIDIEDRLPPVRTDQTQVDQLVFNLLANARDAMPQGGRLSVRAARSGDDQIELVVEDTGEGIAPEDLPRIQEPFFTKKKKGTGLGLSIVRNIVWEMRGGLSFESQPGRGTKVHVGLPVADGSEATKEASSE